MPLSLKQMLGADVLSDGGDCLQGSSWTAFANTELIAHEMNEMGYDLGVVGNHDVARGDETLRQWMRACSFPILGADKNYTIIEREGYRIGVIGLLFVDIAEKVQQAIRAMREEADVDLLVGIFHSGWEGGVDNENKTRQIAEQVAGFDLILYGHDHHAAIHRVKNECGKDVLCIGCGCSGMVAIINLNSSTEGLNAGWEFEVEFVDASVKNRAREKRYPEYAEWLNSPVCTLGKRIAERDSFFGPSAFISLFHAMQFWATGADVSLASPVNYDSVVEAGVLRMRDMFTLYRFDTQIFTMRLMGREIKEVLERSYGRWANDMRSPEDEALLMDYILDDGKTKGLKNISLNMVSAEGVDYTVDVTKPVGEKVTILRMSDGSEFSEDKEYTVAVNSHHGMGWGRLLPDVELRERIVSVCGFGTREGLVEYLRKQNAFVSAKELLSAKGVFVPSKMDNWKFVPEEWAAEALRRDRITLFGRE